MKILVAGDGKVGKTLVRQLSAEGNDLTIIDIKPEVLEESMETYDVMAVQGNCAAMHVLEQAGVHEADLLIAATGSDEVNLLSCMTAYVMNTNIHTIARIRNPEYGDQVYMMKRAFALSLTVNPDKQAADEIERLLKYPGFLKREAFAKGRVEIVELKLKSGNKLCNVALSEMNQIVKCKVLICAVQRQDNVVIPGGNFVLQEGDRIFVTGTVDELEHLLKNLGIITHKVKRVMICGGSRLAYYLSEQLIRSGIYVQLIEKDHDRCLQLAEALPQASIIQGDASSQTLLESEGLDQCDALITMTGIDETNMIISLYGEHRGISQIITKVGHTANNKILDSLALGSVVCPKELSCSTITRYVRAMKNQTGAAVTVHNIADGRAEAVEFVVDKSTHYDGVPLKNLKIRKNVLLACITHKGKTEIARGDSFFSVGDTVIVVTISGNVIYQLDDIFE